jgi:hypothetical protein
MFYKKGRYSAHYRCIRKYLSDFCRIYVNVAQIDLVNTTEINFYA